MVKDLKPLPVIELMLLLRETGVGDCNKFDDDPVDDEEEDGGGRNEAP